MGLFEKKKIYKVAWSYRLTHSIYTEIIEARNPAKAWEKIKKEQALPIALVSLEELSSYRKRIY